MSWKLAGLLLGGGLMFIFNIVLMRQWGPGSFGLWAFILSWTGLFSILIDFGFNPLITRDVARFPEKGSAYLRHIVQAKAILFFAALLLLIATSLMHPVARLHMGTMVLALIYLASVSLVETGQAFTHAYEQFKTGFSMSIVHKAAIAVTGLCALYGGVSLPILLASLCAVSLLGMLFTLRRLTLYILPEEPAHKIQPTLSLWASAWPLFLQNVFIVLYFKIDTVMLTSMRGLTETGVYNAGYRFFELSNLLPTALLAAVVASFSRQLNEPGGMKRLPRLILLFIGSAVVGVAILIGLSIVIQQGWLGEGYERSPRVLRILSIALLFYYPNFLLTTTLVLINRLKAMLSISVAALILNVLLNWYVIPRWGAYGAAGSTVVTEAFISVACLSVIGAYVRWRKY